MNGAVVHDLSMCLTVDLDCLYPFDEGLATDFLKLQCRQSSPVHRAVFGTQHSQYCDGHFMVKLTARPTRNETDRLMYREYGNFTMEA